MGIVLPWARATNCPDVLMYTCHCLQSSDGWQKYLLDFPQHSCSGCRAQEVLLGGDIHPDRLTGSRVLFTLFLFTEIMGKIQATG